jgi:hypothetical protein
MSDLLEESAEYKLEIFIPGEFLGKLQEAITRSGAGQVGLYDHCMAYYPVKGCWRPLEGSNPYQGKVGEVETGEEIKVEINCRHEFVAKVLQAVREVHPYETPLVNILYLANHLFLEEDGKIRNEPISRG